MKNRPIHENLDTSFVNLPALIRYLRRRQFAGNIRVELSGYEADIFLTADNQMRVREHDRATGRVAEGEEALQRVLIRAREPDGIINVYQIVEADAPIAEDAAPQTEINLTAAPRVENKAVIAPIKETVVHIAPQMPHRNGNSKTEESESPLELDLPKPKFAFELSNSVESKAKQASLSPEDWQTLLNLTAELLDTVDKSLAEANLEFAPAFEKARAEISKDYPFMNPANETFDYRNGKIIVRKQLNAKLFAASINEALRRILDKLGRNPKFLNIYFGTTQKVVELIEKRRSLYDKFSITPQLERIVGG